jgi:hypothetical protein
MAIKVHLRFKTGWSEGFDLPVADMSWENIEWKHNQPSLDERLTADSKLK